jgi:hypothetical protein
VHTARSMPPWGSASAADRSQVPPGLPTCGSGQAQGPPKRAVSAASARAASVMRASLSRCMPLVTAAGAARLALESAATVMPAARTAGFAGRTAMLTTGASGFTRRDTVPLASAAGRAFPRPGDLAIAWACPVTSLKVNQPGYRFEVRRVAACPVRAAGLERADLGIVAGVIHVKFPPRPIWILGHLPVGHLVRGNVRADLSGRPAELPVTAGLQFPFPRPALVRAALVDVRPEERDAPRPDLVRVMPAGGRHAVDAHHPVMRRAQALGPHWPDTAVTAHHG